MDEGGGAAGGSDATGAIGARPTRIVLLAAVFVCAACGLVYELALVALGSYLLGSSITQTSVVISVTLFAMGVGAMAAKPLTRRPVRAFVAVELALAVDAPGDLRFVTDEVLAAATVFPPDRTRREVEASTLLDPVILDYERAGWVGY